MSKVTHPRWVGKEVASHRQEPFTQNWPQPQAGPVPHWQAPPVEQLLALFGSQATHSAPPIPQ